MIKSNMSLILSCFNLVPASNLTAGMEERSIEHRMVQMVQLSRVRRPPTLLSWGHALATTNNRTVVQYNSRTTTEHEQQHNIITTVTTANTRSRMCDATLNAYLMDLKWSIYF